MVFKLDFDISPTYSAIILAGVIIIYSSVMFFIELFVPECTGLEDCFDFDRRMARLYVWDVGWIDNDFRHMLHMGLLTLSYQLFGNYKVLVLASSALLLVVSYLLTTVLSGKRIGGFISIAVILQSSIFFNYDTSVTYPSFWALLFVTAVYLATTTKQYLSPIPYVLSIPAKALTALFLPGLLAFLWLEGKKKLFVSYLVISGLGLSSIFLFEFLNSKDVGGLFLFSEVDYSKFFMGFVSWMWKGFGSDQITLMILVVFGALLFFNRKKIPHSGSVLALSGSMVLISPILTGLTTYDIWPYRMLPLVVFTGVIVGMVISNIDKINLKMFLAKA